VLLGRPALFVLAATVLGCTGGQSGTETPAPHDDGGLRFEDGGPFDVLQAPSCACTLADRSALLRAILIELEPCRVRARVEEQLATAPELDLELATGTEVDVARVTGCGEDLPVEPGDPVLLVFAPQQGDDSASSALVATWGNQHVFGDEIGAIAVPEAERNRLLEAESCSAWFEQQAAEATDAATMGQAELAPTCDPPAP
jgi:hypothetical protein